MVVLVSPSVESANASWECVDQHLRASFRLVDLQIFPHEFLCIEQVPVCHRISIYRIEVSHQVFKIFQIFHGGINWRSRCLGDFLFLVIASQ